jgi:hypothetical protein
MKALPSPTGTIGANPVTTSKDLSASSNSISNPKPSEYSFVNKLFKNVDAPKQVLDEIKKDPIDTAIMLMESGGNPKAKNRDSTASGLFQLIKKTAGNLGVKDVFDAKENYEGYKKLRKQAEKITGNDPALVYANHYLGTPVLQKVLSGESLTKEERAQVDTLINDLLPKYLGIYKSVVA